MTEKGRPYKGFFYIALFATALLTFIVYLPVLSNGFVNWDDPFYIYENDNIRSLDLKFLKWAFTSKVLSNYHPITMISHALDYAIYGLDARGHHLTSIIIHLINASLVFSLIRLLIISGLRGLKSLSLYEIERFAITAAFITAIFFALHPLRVESVAWISERKDLLCALFFLLTLITYIKYAENKEHKALYYGLTALFFVLSLLSKPMSVTLPVVLLIIDFYPLKRLGQANIKKALIEKVPFFAISLIFSALAVVSQSGRALAPIDESYSIVSRLGVSIHGYIFYLYKTLLPTELAPLYPYPESLSFLSLKYGGSLLLFIAITILALYYHRRFRTLAVVWAYYVITLLPVIGIVQIGLQSTADRYSYLPILGPSLLVALAITVLLKKGRGGLFIAGALVLIIGVALSIATVLQSGMWKDSITLWSRNLQFHPRSYTSYYNLAEAQVDRGEVATALINYSQAIDIKPRKSASIYVNRGGAYLLLKEYGKAMRDFTIALEIDPDHADAYFRRGLLEAKLADAGQKSALVRAIKDYTRAIEVDPEFADAYHARAIARYRLGFLKGAREDYLSTIMLLPDDGVAHLNLAKLYLRIDNRAEAKKHFDMARKLGVKIGGKNK